jgi:hypothetical protein
MGWYCINHEAAKNNMHSICWCRNGRPRVRRKEQGEGKRVVLQLDATVLLIKQPKNHGDQMLLQEWEGQGEENEQGEGNGVVSFVNENYDHTRMMKRKKRVEVEKPQEPATKKRKGVHRPGTLPTLKHLFVHC